jgi:hypothetical protein
VPVGKREREPSIFGFRLFTLAYENFAITIGIHRTFIAWNRIATVIARRRNCNV